MLRRLYWLLPDVESARRTADDLLLARIEHRHMHFLARRGTDLGALHEASEVKKEAPEAIRGARAVRYRATIDLDGRPMPVLVWIENEPVAPPSARIW